MIIRKKQIRKVISCILFIILIINLFIDLTYLLRNVAYDRNHIVGFENEEQPIDMVYIGGSAAYVYWQPLKAWNDCGFTSYNYATSTIQAETIKYYIKEVQKSQTPELYVIGLRSFQYWDEEFDEIGLRYATDSMELFGGNRVQMISDYLENRIEPEGIDKASFYFDIIKYHTNIDNLSNPEAWMHLIGDIKPDYKGFYMTDWYAYLNDNNPSSFKTNERATLKDGCKEILIDLLEYCKTEKLNVLFVVCPYSITMDDYAKYNTMSDLIKEYGFDYLNTNDYYDEMNIKFDSDFYNSNHVNIFGAEKYTEYLEQYIVNKYDMPNHLGDKEYNEWNEEYIKFKSDEVTFKQSILEKMNEYYKSNIE